METKTCNRCQVEKDINLFQKGTSYKDGRRGVCKKCHSEYMTDYYKKNPSKVAPSKPRSAKKRHRLSNEEYITLISLYDGKCHSCKERVGTCIDHDHDCCEGAFSCGKCVRGFLCGQCNTALGLLKNNKSYILSLVTYIDSYLGHKH